MIGFWLVGLAWAQDRVAERYRLEEELVKLAQRNTWTGVARTYRRLLDLEVALPAQDHYLGAQAALAEGQTLLAWHRLNRVNEATVGSDPVQIEALAATRRALDEIGARYGLVSIYVGNGAVPVLYRDAMPFPQQERDAIVTAQQTVSSIQAFRGFLPVGNYAVDAVKFEVVASEEWLVITAGER